MLRRVAKSDSVKSVYCILEATRVVFFPSNVVWNVGVPPKIRSFTWEASVEKLLTLNHLQRRGWSLANRCSLCFDHQKSIEHSLALWEDNNDAGALILFLGCIRELQIGRQV